MSVKLTQGQSVNLSTGKVTTVVGPIEEREFYVRVGYVRSLGMEFAWPQ